MIKQETVKVFVYGTLMKGFGMDLSSVGKFLTKATLPNHAMFNVSWFPGIVESEGDSVIGEVFEVDKKHIPGLDLYEGAPNLYRRESAHINGVGDVQYYLYNGVVDGKSKIDSGDYREFTEREGRT